VYPQEWSDSLGCGEVSEICIMRTSGCNREENWQKIGLFAYGCEGKKGKGHKETRKNDK